MWFWRVAQCKRYIYIWQKLRSPKSNENCPYWRTIRVAHPLAQGHGTCCATNRRGPKHKFYFAETRFNWTSICCRKALAIKTWIGLIWMVFDSSYRGQPKQLHGPRGARRRPVEPNMSCGWAASASRVCRYRACPSSINHRQFRLAQPCRLLMIACHPLRCPLLPLAQPFAWTIALSITPCMAHFQSNPSHALLTF
jgi:hypothetical protein